VFDFKDTMPIVEALGNKNLQDIHWEEIKQITKMFDYPLEERQFNLGILIDFNVAKYQEEVVAVSITATQEFNLRNQLEEIKQIWSVTEFDVIKHKDKDALKLNSLDVI
jgi:hypothetical protein